MTQKPRLLQVLPCTQSMAAFTQGNTHLPYCVLQRDIPHAASLTHGKAAGPGTAMPLGTAGTGAVTGGGGSDGGSAALVDGAGGEACTTGVATTGAGARRPPHEASWIETRTATAGRHRRIDMTSRVRPP